jgi:hypothetical protein
MGATGPAGIPPAITRARYSPASTIFVGLPSLSGIISVGTIANIANSVRYTPLIVTSSVTLDQMWFEVTTAPASSANFRGALYAADTDWQPTGAPLFDQAVAVASGFTGVKTAALSSVAVPVGRYLIAYNMDQAMTHRRFTAPMYHVDPAGGASPGAVQYVAAQTYGAMPNPGTAFTGGGGASNTGYSHVVLLRWTTP